MWQLHDRLWSGCRKGDPLARHAVLVRFELVSSGVPIRQVQEWLGHSSITMTMRYAHLAP